MHVARPTHLDINGFVITSQAKIKVESSEFFQQFLVKTITNRFLFVFIYLFF